MWQKLWGEEQLLAWDDYFSDEELAAFHSEFLAEGEWDGRLLMLPIAKSTEAFYLNQTLLDRFSAETGITKLDSFADVFAAATAYYAWSDGRQFMQMNDYYHYAYAGMEAAGAAATLEQANYRQLYAAVDTMLETHTFYDLPRYSALSEVQALTEDALQELIALTNHQE